MAKIKLKSTSLTKNLAKRSKLVQHIDRAVKDWDEPFSFSYSPKEKDDAFHPSGDCTPSVVDLHRKALATLADEDTFGPISASLRKTFLVGHFWHAFYQHIVLDKLEFCEPAAIEHRGVKGWGGQTPIEMDRIYRWYPFHWATGQADIAPCSIPGYTDCVVDFKTMNGIDYSRPYAPAHYVDKWECQLNVYMDWFDLERALIIGVQKDSPHELKEFEFVRNQPLIDAIYEKWLIVSECLDDDEVPHIDYDIELPLLGPVA